MSTTTHEMRQHGERKPTPAATPALAWGYNNAGGLGAGGAARALRPIPVMLPTHTVDVQGGTDFTVALTGSGHVYAWGGNRWGQLGDPHAGRVRFAPARVDLPGDPHVTAIAVGQDHVLALTRGGRVFAWGRNHHGQLGDGTRVDRSTPVAVQVGRVAQIAAGNVVSAAVTAHGGVQVWGSAIPATDFTDRHAVAAAQSARFITRPQALALPHRQRPAMVDAGLRHLVVLTTGGDLVSLGLNPAGRPISRNLSVPAAQGRVTAVGAGDNHTVVLTRSGAVLAWGANYHGQLGNGTTTNSDTLVHVRIPKLRGRVVQVVAAGDHVLARTSDGHVHGWGHGGWGQLGTGAGENQLRPAVVPLPNTTSATGLYAGRYHAIVTTR